MSGAQGSHGGTQGGQYFHNMNKVFAKNNHQASLAAQRFHYKS